MTRITGLALAMLGLGGAPALAATMPFFGTRTNERVAPVAPTVCPVPPTVLELQFLPGAPAFNQGTSNFGAFAATQYECALGPVPSPNADSPWRFQFANGSLFGTKYGNPTGPVPGGIGFVSFFTITGGTGYFGGATGSFNGVGDVIFAGRTPAAIENFSGFVTVPAPSVLALFGLSLAGLASVRGRMARTR